MGRHMAVLYDDNNMSDGDAWDDINWTNMMFIADHIDAILGTTT